MPDPVNPQASQANPAAPAPAVAASDPRGQGVAAQSATPASNSAPQNPNIAAVDPNLQKAMEGGCKEPAAPTREQRVADLLSAMEHAVAHNAPITGWMITEMHALLGA